MTKRELILRPICSSDKEAFIRANRLFIKADPDWTFAFHFDENKNFKEYVHMLGQWSRGRNLPEKFVPNTFLISVVQNEIVGRISIRHHLNDFLYNIGGHVGYGTTPGFRKKGYATQMLKKTIPICADLGIEKVLITCDENNLASKKVIENCGGIFDNKTDEPSLEFQKLRYWIDTGR